MTIAYLLISASIYKVAARVRDNECRDRFLRPFLNTSIWNTAIGSLAKFELAGLFPNDSTSPADFHNDQDFIVRANSSDPLSDWIS